MIQRTRCLIHEVESTLSVTLLCFIVQYGVYCTQGHTETKQVYEHVQRHLTIPLGVRIIWRVDFVIK